MTEEVKPDAAAAEPKAEDKKPATEAAKPKPKKTKTKPKSDDYEKPQSIEAAVKLYNEMVLTAIDLGVSKITAVEKFVDLKTGQAACERLHQSILKARDPKSTEKENGNMSKKAKKTTTKKNAAAPKKRGSFVKLTDDIKITWVAGKKIPFKEGSGKYTRSKSVHDNTKSATTLKALRAKKIKQGTVRTLLKMGVIKAS